MPKSYRDIVAAARREVVELTPDEALRRVDTGAVLVDIRETPEHLEGVVPGALLVPRGLLESTLPGRIPHPDTELLLFCAGGNRSVLAARTLTEMGYPNVRSVAGGVTAWRQAGLPWTSRRADDDDLTDAQQDRYRRHLSLPEVGAAGQRRLLDSSVLLIGAGGLGSPVALYLAAAGVGRLVVVDDDTVDRGNLQRQVLHTSERVGMPKVDSARLTVGGLNPDVLVDAHRERVAAGNVLDLMKGVDVVVDGADNFPTRYLVNDAALHARIPVVHGSVLRFEGQVSVFDPYQGPCYRCLYPLPPPPELAPSCAEVGVLGVLPGVIGTIQAVETLKVLLGIGETLAGRLLVYDALDQTFTTLNVARRPACPACSDPENPPTPVDYDWTCAGRDHRSSEHEGA